MLTVNMADDDVNATHLYYIIGRSQRVSLTYHYMFSTTVLFRQRVSSLKRCFRVYATVRSRELWQVYIVNTLKIWAVLVEIYIYVIWFYSIYLQNN